MAQVEHKRAVARPTEPRGGSAREPYLVVRRALTTWNVLTVVAENGLLMGEVRASFDERQKAWKWARRASEHNGIPLLEGRA